MEKMKTKKLKLFANEKVVVLPVSKTPKGNRYAITNWGRVISFTTSPLEGIILKQVKIRIYHGVTFAGQTYLVQRLVASHFVKKYKRDQRFVIHLDYDNDNNHFKNLKWVDREAMNIHVRNNPSPKKRATLKLSVTQVKKIKEILLKNKSSLKSIAEKYGVSDMQIHRIKTGENWGYVNI